MTSKRQTPAQLAGHTHAEAFCLMWYEDEVTGERERLWNSRDGVTPFVISSRAGNTATHVDWHLDSYAPTLIPDVGDRVFVDMTEERAREINREKVELFWEHPDYPLRERYGSKEEALESFMEGWGHRWTDGGGTEHFSPGPDVVVVTREMHEAFVISAVGRLKEKADEATSLAREQEADQLRALREEYAEARKTAPRTSSPKGEIRPGDVVHVNGVLCRVHDVKNSRLTLYVVGG